MGKKTTKRKTRWRALSIGEVPSDTEEESQENTSTYRGEYPYHRTHNGRPHYYQQRSSGGGAHYGGTYSKYSNYSSQSTPTRNRNYHYQHNGEKYKSSRSNSTTSEPKITFNEDEYTRITTPRQDVLFKKGYLSKKKPSVAAAPTPSDGVAAANGGGGGGGGPSGGSCGDSNPSTGYSSTTGGGTPEHHSQDGGEYRDGEFDQHQQFIFHNGFVDSSAIYFVNAGVPPGFEYAPMMLVGPAGQFIHPMEFYPPAPGMCFPPQTYRAKRYSTDSQTESASPNNETDSSNKTANTGNECSSSSVPSSTNGCDTGNASSSCTDDHQQQQQQQQEDGAVATDAAVDDVAPSPPTSVDEREAATAIETNHQGIPIGMGIGTVPPGAMFPPTQFIFPAPHPGFVPYPSSHHQIYMNGIQLQGSTSVNETVESKRYKKRRRRKISRLQNENAADADYTDETTSSSSDENEPEPIAKHDQPVETPSTDLSARHNMSSEPTDSSRVDATRVDDTDRTSTETTPTNDPTNAYDGPGSIGRPDGAAADAPESPDDLSIVNESESSALDARKGREVESRPTDEEPRPAALDLHVETERGAGGDGELENGETERSRSRIDPRRGSGTEDDAARAVPAERPHVDSDGTVDDRETESRDDGRRPATKTIYKVDAEEFVPMSMRAQSHEGHEATATTNGAVDEELRAKFENYLNRNAENLEKQNAFELQIARSAAGSVPETGASTPVALRLDPDDVREFVPRNGELVEYVVPVSKSYPPKREHYARHEHGGAHVKKYYQNGAHYAHHDQYAGYKRRSYGQNDRHYQRHGSSHYHARPYRDREQSSGYGGARGARTNAEHEGREEEEPAVGVNGVDSSATSKDESDGPTTSTGASNVSSSYSQTTSENDPVECGGDVERETSTKRTERDERAEAARAQENRARGERDERRVDPATKSKPTSKGRETAPTTDGRPVEAARKQPHLPPGFSAKPSPKATTQPHPKAQPVAANAPQSSDSAPPTPLKIKNYAQVVKKSNERATTVEAAEPPTSPSGVAKRVDGSREPEFDDLSDSSPSKSAEDEWIAVPTRKKGKSKQASGKASGGTDGTPYHVPRAEPAVVAKPEKQTRPAGAKGKVDKQPHAAAPAREPAPNRNSARHGGEKKVAESPPVERVREAREAREPKTASRRQEVVHANGHDAPVVKATARPEVVDRPKERRAERQHEGVKKTSAEERVVQAVRVETPTRKSKKSKAKTKKSPKAAGVEASRGAKAPASDRSPLGFDIVDSIGRLNRRTADDTKTNVEMSLEIDKLIQKGLYANIEQTIRSLGGDTDAFLSIVDPSIDFIVSPKSLENGSISPSVEKKQHVLDEHVMRTLGECQRMFAYKTVREPDARSPTGELDGRGATTATATTPTKARDRAEKKVESKTPPCQADETTKSAKKSKKSKKHRDESKRLDENGADAPTTAEAEASDAEIQKATATESQPVVPHKKETLDMDTVNAILRDLSAERKREIRLDVTTENGETPSRTESADRDPATPVVEGDGIETETPGPCLSAGRLESGTRVAEPREPVDAVAEQPPCSASIGETSEPSCELAEDEDGVRREPQSDSVDQISDLCESADVSSPESDRKCSIFYSIEDLNDRSPVEETDGPEGVRPVITQEPHADRSRTLSIDGGGGGDSAVSAVSSPDDPRSASSEERNVSLTEAVRNWLHETKERSPELEVLKSPEKLKLEGAGRTRTFGGSDTDESDDDDDGARGGRRTGPKNVKGNPLSAGSVSAGRGPGRVDEHAARRETRADGSDDRRVATTRRRDNAAATTTTTKTERRRGASRSPTVEDGLEVGEDSLATASDARPNRKEYRIAENVVNIAREIANTVNPVVNGIGLGGGGGDVVPNGYEITENGIKVRDVAVIRRTVSESGGGGGGEDPVDSLIQNGINDARADRYVKKSRSCIEMSELRPNAAPPPPADGRVPSAETRLNGAADAPPVCEADLLECWENDLNVDAYRTTSALIIDDLAPDRTTRAMNIRKTTPDDDLDNGVERRNNNVDVDAYDCNLNSFGDAKCPKEKRLRVDESGEDVLEAYESAYGRNLDYLEIKQRVFETAQRQIPPCPQNTLYPPGSDRVVPCGAICCNVM